ncbi:glycosyltransferase [Clostridium botulinum]
MRILLATDQYERFTGTVKFIDNIINFLSSKESVDISIVTYCFKEYSFFDKRYGDIFYKEEITDKVKIIFFRQYKIDSKPWKIRDLRNTDFFKMLISYKKPDVVHICHPRRVAELAFVAKSMNISYIITLTDSFVICPNLFLVKENGEICKGPKHGIECNTYCNNLKIRCENRLKESLYIMSNASAIITPSNFLKEIIKEEFNDLSNISVIKHGVKKQSVKNKKIYKKDDELVFGFTSVPTYIKGIYVLIDSFNKFKENQKVKLKVFGNGNEDLLIFITKNKNIEFCGEFNQDEIANVYNSIDMLICPSIWYETYSFVVNEALSFNVPALCSNIGAMGEFVKNGINGLTFEPGNSKQLYYLIKIIAENPEILNVLKSNIDVTDRTIKKEAQAYYNLYSKSYNDLKSENNDNLDNWENTYRLFNNKINLIEDTLWCNYIEQIMNLVNIQLEYLPPMRIRLSYLKNKYLSKTVNYIIWGASNSGIITKKIVDVILPNFKLIGFIDKYRKGEIDGIKIYSIEYINDISFEYAFICTTPGKKEATKKLFYMNKNMVEEFMYGYGQ